MAVCCLYRSFSAVHNVVVGAQALDTRLGEESGGSRVGLEAWVRDRKGLEDATIKLMGDM